MLLKFFFNVSIEDTTFTCMLLEKMLRTYLTLLGWKGVESMLSCLGNKLSWLHLDCRVKVQGVQS